MNPTQIILIVLGAVLFILALKVIKNVLKVIFYTILILVIITGVTGFFFVRDFKEFKDGMTTKESLYLLRDGEDYITGFTMISYNLTQAESLTKNELTSIEDKEYSDMQKDYFKVFIFNLEAFPETNSSEQELLLSYLKDENKLLGLIDNFIPEDVADPKAGAFAALVVYSAKDSPTYILKQYKAENIIVYPETFMFKVIKFLIR